jgi:hypothetical protein
VLVSAAVFVAALAGKQLMKKRQAEEELARS